MDNGTGICVIFISEQKVRHVNAHSQICAWQELKRSFCFEYLLQLVAMFRVVKHATLHSATLFTVLSCARAIEV